MVILDRAAAACLLAAPILYAVSWGVLLGGRRRSGFVLFAAGWAFNALLFMLNWIAGGEPPFANMYHVQTFAALCLFPLYLTLRARDGLGWLAPYFAFAAAVPLVGALFMAPGIVWRRMPALQSPWFVPHVTSYMLAYALAAAAFAVTIMDAVRRRIRRLNDGRDRAAASHRILLLAFPFMTFGLVSGATWAEAAWGTYWSWDIKETWALVTWGLYLLYFFCCKTPRLRLYAAAVHILAFLALMVTFLAVNLLPKLASGLHNYAAL